MAAWGCLGLPEPGAGVWLGLCWCRMLHHLLGFGADFLGVFGWLESASGPVSASCTSLWWSGPFWSYRALRAQKTADITTRQQFLSVWGLLGSLCCCRGVHVVLLGFGGSFQ